MSIYEKIESVFASLTDDELIAYDAELMNLTNKDNQDSCPICKKVSMEIYGFFLWHPNIDFEPISTRMSRLQSFYKDELLKRFKQLTNK